MPSAGRASAHGLIRHTLIGADARAVL